MRAKGQRQVRQGSGKREKGNEKKAARESKTERVSGESERERERYSLFIPRSHVQNSVESFQKSCFWRARLHGRYTFGACKHRKPPTLTQKIPKL